MKHLLLCICLACTGIAATAQTDSTDVVMAFRLTDYMIPSGDTTTIVQVTIPPVWPVRIKEKQYGLIKALWNDNAAYDTTVKASGRCHLIKGDFYYFGMKHSKDKTLQQGDLLYTLCRVPVNYKGLLFSTGLHAISYTRVTEEQFYYSVEMFTMDKNREEALLDSMVADIRYTGKAMQEQMPDGNPLVKEGPYAGKHVFTVMQEAKKEELKEFLKYIEVRPSKYAGHVWKISEIFATWVISGAPMVVKK